MTESRLSPPKGGARRAGGEGRTGAPGPDTSTGVGPVQGLGDEAAASLDSGRNATAGQVWRDRHGLLRRQVAVRVKDHPWGLGRQTTSSQSAEPRSGKLGRSWWFVRCDDGRCGAPTCGVCRVGALRRCLQRYEAVDLVDRLPLRLVTATRTKRAKHGVDIERFAQAVRYLDLWLRAAGAAGAVWVFEVKTKRRELGARGTCCGSPGCPLCGGTGRMAPGHLHAHGLVAGRARWSYAAMQKLSGPRDVDPAWGNLDVVGDIRSGWGYLAGYLQELKDGNAAAWFHGLVPGMKLVRATGTFRGRAKRQGTETDPCSLEGGELVTALWTVRDAPAKGDAIRRFADGARDVRRDCRKLGVGAVPTAAAVRLDTERARLGRN